RSTQAFEHNLDSMQKLTKKFLELNQQTSNINQQYTNLVTLNQEKNLIEQSGLKAIQQELSRLVTKMQKN
ncbi:MAG: methyl-accepting chemotaxis protein, partial [Waterburya sp.]